MATESDIVDHGHRAPRTGEDTYVKTSISASPKTAPRDPQGVKKVDDEAEAKTIDDEKWRDARHFLAAPKPQRVAV